MQIIQALGQSYHPSCFRCSVCQTELDGIPFTRDHEGRIYCVPDYHRYNIPIKFCPVFAGGSLRFVA